MLLVEEKVCYFKKRKKKKYIYIYIYELAAIKFVLFFYECSILLNANT